MKDQYFGDINDYRKYGILRALQSKGQRTLLVAWMPHARRRQSRRWIPLLP